MDDLSMLATIMTTYKDIIALWPTRKEFASDIGVRVETVRGFQRRNVIPPEHWLALLQAAPVRGIEITADVLIRVAASSK